MTPALTTQALLEAPAIRRIIDAYPSLPRLQQRFADYVLHNPFEAATSPIEQVALAAGVSLATANRFASLVGAESYPAFRAELINVFKSILEPVERLKAFKPDASSLGTISAALTQSAANIAAAEAQLDAAECEALIALLRKSAHIYTMGFGSSAILARAAVQLFELHCANVRLLGADGGAWQAALQLGHITAEDCVLGISFPRYSSETVRLLEFARSRKAKIIVLTDGPLSPLVELADHLIYTRSDNGLYNNSNVAGLAVLEGIAAALTRHDSAAVQQARELTDRLMPHFYFSHPRASAKPKAATPAPRKK